MFACFLFMTARCCCCLICFVDLCLCVNRILSAAVAVAATNHLAFAFCIRIRICTVCALFHCVLCLNYLCLPGFAYITLTSSHPMPSPPNAITSTTTTNTYVSQDYCEEFREIISTKTKKNGTGPTENGITLVNQHKFTEELPVMSIANWPLPLLPLLL